MNRSRKWTIVILTVLVLTLIPFNAFASEAGAANETANALKTLTGSDEKQVLKDETVLPAGDSISDWVAMTLALTGSEEAYSAYLDRLEEYVTDCYEEQGYIDDVKATETQRIALTVLALGGNPEAFGTDENGETINLIADSTWNFTGGSIGQQGTNGYIYGLLLLDAKNYEIPEDADMTREQLVDAILDAQSANGGFSLGNEGEGSVDITAMALQALAPYTGDSKVDKAVEKALGWISKQLSEYATFVSYEEESCETSAQVILAMAALEIDIESDKRFISNGMTLLDGMNEFVLDDNTYRHTLSEETGNLMATQHALLAIEAINKSASDGGWILDFSDYQGPVETSGGGISGTVIVIGAIVVTLIAILIIVIMLMRKKRK